MSAILDWLFGIPARHVPTVDELANVRKELDEAIEAQHEAHRKSKNGIEASMKVNRALSATADTIRLANRGSR